MTRWKAALTHLGISACVGACAAGLIFGVWYPPPYSHLVGADELVMLLLGVDVVLGPLLTLVIFRSGKKSLRFDLTVIAVLQAIAFLYGMSVVVRARPAFIIGVVDRFNIVASNEIDPNDFANAKDPRFQRAPWTGPMLIGAAIPTTSQERTDLLFSSVVAGKDLDKFPMYYVDYEQVVPSILRHAKPLDDLRQKAAIGHLLDDVLRKEARSSADTVWVPLRARVSDSVMLIDRSTGKPVGVVSIDPW